MSTLRDPPPTALAGMQKLLQGILGPIQTLVALPLFQAPADHPQLPTVLVWWSVLDHLGKTVEARKQALRVRLLESAGQLGKADAKGGPPRLDVVSGVVKRSERGGGGYDFERVVELLQTRGIPLKGVVVEQRKVVASISVSAMELLYSTGVLSETEIASVRKPATQALLVEEVPALLVAIEEVLPPPVEPSDTIEP